MFLEVFRLSNSEGVRLYRAFCLLRPLAHRWERTRVSRTSSGLTWRSPRVRRTGDVSRPQVRCVSSWSWRLQCQQTGLLGCNLGFSLGLSQIGGLRLSPTVRVYVSGDMTAGVYCDVSSLQFPVYRTESWYSLSILFITPVPWRPNDFSTEIFFSV